MHALAADLEEVGAWPPGDFVQQQQTVDRSSLEELAQQLDQTVCHQPCCLRGIDWWLKTLNSIICRSINAPVPIRIRDACIVWWRHVWHCVEIAVDFSQYSTVNAEIIPINSSEGDWAFCIFWKGSDGGGGG